MASRPRERTLDDVLKAQQMLNINGMVSEAVDAVREARSNYHTAQAIATELHEKTRLSCVHAATAELYGHTTPSRQAQKKALEQATSTQHVVAQLGATPAGPIADNPFASLRDVLVPPGGRTSSSGARLSLSGTATQLVEGSTGYRAGPPTQPQAPITAAADPPSPMARLQRGSLSGGLTAASKLDAGAGSTSANGRTAAGGPASLSASQMKSRNARQSTSGRLSMSGEAPPSPGHPQATTTSGTAASASPLHHAILSRIERRWSNTGSASMNERTSSSGSDALRPSSRARLSEMGNGPAGIAQPAGRQSLSGSGPATPTAGANTLSPLGASRAAGPGVLSNTTFAQPMRTTTPSQGPKVVTKAAGPGTALPDPTEPPQRRSTSGSTRVSLSGREDDAGFGLAGSARSNRVSQGGGISRQDYAEALSASLAGVGGGRVPGAGPPSLRRVLADRVA